MSPSTHNYHLSTTTLITAVTHDIARVAVSDIELNEALNKVLNVVRNVVVVVMRNLPLSGDD